MSTPIDSKHPFLSDHGMLSTSSVSCQVLQRSTSTLLCNMAFSAGAQSPSSQGKRTSFGPNSSVSSSLLLEKTKASMRRSTPDSEALASSDDEQEQYSRFAHVVAQQNQKPIRRASWRADSYNSSQRKSSLGGASDAFSNSHGGPNSMEASAWASHPSSAGRSSAAGATFPWGSTIWSDSLKGPPARLAEVLPSSVTIRPSSLTEEPLHSPPLRRESTSEAAIPFAIPLHPTLKAYRSQSYSVGQLDQETMSSNHSRPTISVQHGRTRAGSSYAGLQHRPSRPSMLGDFSPDTSILEQLREVDDDDETSTGSSEAGVRLPNTHNRTMEQLAVENAMLRQQAYLNQMTPGAPRPSQASQANPVLRFGGNSMVQMNDNVLEEYDNNSQDTDERPPSQARERYFLMPKP